VPEIIAEGLPEVQPRFQSKLDYFLPLYMRQNQVWRDLFEAATKLLDGFLVRDDGGDPDAEGVYYLRRLFNVDLIPFECMQSLASVFGWLIEVDYERAGEDGLRRQLDEMGRAFRDRLSLRTYNSILYGLGLQGTIHRLGTMDFASFFPAEAWRGIALTDTGLRMDMDSTLGGFSAHSDAVVLTPHIRVDISFGADSSSGVFVDQHLVQRVRSRFEPVRHVIMRIFLQFDFFVAANNFTSTFPSIDPGVVGIVKAYDPAQNTVTLIAFAPIEADALRFMWAPSIALGGVQAFVLSNTAAEAGEMCVLCLESLLVEPTIGQSVAIQAGNPLYHETRQQGVYSRVVVGADLSSTNLLYFVDGTTPEGTVTREFIRLDNDVGLTLSRIIASPVPRDLTYVRALDGNQIELLSVYFPAFFLGDDVSVNLTLGIDSAPSVGA